MAKETQPSKTWDETRKARAIASALCSIWDTWADENEDTRDDALRMVTEQARALDMHQVEGTMASPLNYWTRAYLDDENPEDLTYCEMMQSLAISLNL